MLKITRIGVSYRLKVPKEQASDARAALDNYLHLCPSAQSMIGCIQITHELRIEEMAA